MHLISYQIIHKIYVQKQIMFGACKFIDWFIVIFYQLCGQFYFKIIAVTKPKFPMHSSM